ncbi:MAG: discoidin domain-containing protein [Acidobacteria bacterium]|nr:discoidin domain-containing protein [Acidobacteriota bacterium]
MTKKIPPLSRREFLSAAATSAALSLAPKDLLGLAGAPPQPPSTVRVNIAAKPILFDPDQALGSSMDILHGEILDTIYSPEMVKECLSAGWGPITYRLNTELQIAAWHWNPNGTWSDAVHQSGYFTGNAEPTGFLRDSFGYPLPHRGHTRNGGSEHSYSRITDGDPASYWKSNPYLSKKFTGEDDSLLPQWVVVDLGAVHNLNVLRIAWAHPFATQYTVQYWTGEHAMERPTSGVWSAFPGGIITQGRGGVETLQLAREPMAARFLRILMTASSGTCSTHDASDPRSSLGYAIHEIYAGSFANNGDFIDAVQHRPDQNQTATYCSSIDPWHSTSDLDVQAGDQTGFDLFFTSGITNKLPAMVPIAMVYGTPEDAAAQLAYLKKRGYSISYVEMGEEPDGQYMLPEDYAALYLQFASALHQVDPNLKLGGPVFEGVNEDIRVWPDAQGRTSWLGRFVDYLKARGRLGDLAFVSFEHYPYPPCEITWTDLYREPELMRHILEVWRADGLPENIPLMNTESNVTYALSQPMTDIFSALWLADSVGAFLSAGGAVYYHSPIQPEPLHPGCHGSTTYGNFVANEKLQIRTHTAQYHASRLINLEWVRHGAGEHRLYPAACDLKDAAGNSLITAYAVHRPEGEWSLMLVNKDQSNAQAVRMELGDSEFAGPVKLVSFGSEQYVWRSDGPNSHPDPNDPPTSRTLTAGPNAVFTLPKASVTILRGHMRS